MQGHAGLDAALSYRGVHKRLRRLRGRAAEHACVGCQGQAQEWSYDHTDLDEVRVLHRGRVVALSANVMEYSPRCAACHRFYDQAVLETKAQGGGRS